MRSCSAAIGEDPGRDAVAGFRRGRGLFRHRAWCATFPLSRIASTISRRSSARRISATTRAAARRPVQARARRRHVRAPPADPGGDDLADRRGDRRGLQPRGVAVMVEAEHICMSMRGVKKHGRLDGDDASSPACFAAIASEQVALPRSCCGRPADRDAPARNRRRHSEEGAEFAPRFSADGLIACVTVDARDGAVLMLAHMNAEALDKTLASGDRALLVAIARRALAQGRYVGADPAPRRAARRLRPGRAAGEGRRRRRRRSLPHRATIVLLSPRERCATASRCLEL